MERVKFGKKGITMFFIVKNGKSVINVELMEPATCSVDFSFNNIMHRQIDGVAMGFPLGPCLANIFVGFYESKTVSNHLCTTASLMTLLSFFTMKNIVIPFFPNLTLKGMVYAKMFCGGWCCLG